MVDHHGDWALTPTPKHSLGLAQGLGYRLLQDDPPDA